MNQLRNVLRKPRRGRHPARPGLRPPALAGSVTAVALALLTVATPSQASAGEALEIKGGRLLNHGTEVRVRVSYQCDAGRTAGVGIFLTQGGTDGADVFGGAGSGQLPCTGETDDVILTISVGSGRFVPGCAAATVSLFTSQPGTPDKIEQLTDDVGLERR